MSYLPPINFSKWIEDNRHLLKPPVGNKCVYEDADFIVMVVGGPNARKDFHINQGEEFFFMVEGDMVLRTFEDGDFKNVEIREGEIFLLPGGVPHSPQRKADTIGLVIERKRASDELDGMRWYCDECRSVLFEEFFHLGDIETDLKPVIVKFAESKEMRTCESCGHYLTLPTDKPAAS